MQMELQGRKYMNILKNQFPYNGKYYRKSSQTKIICLAAFFFIKIKKPMAVHLHDVVFPT